MGLEILGLLVAGAGASYGWWKLQTRRERLLLSGKEFEDQLDGDAKVVFSLAQHAARSRDHRYMSSLHLLYALVQDESFQTALGKIDGSLETLDTFLQDELDKIKPNDPHEAELPKSTIAYQHALGHAFLSAQSFERQVTPTDMFVYLYRDEETRERLRKGTPAPSSLLFAMVHGMAEPATTLPDRTHVHVVLRNDDYTTREFVSALLRETFGMTEDDADALMMKTHNEGRAVIGRFTSAEAREKLEKGRARAREMNYPLWIGLEDC